jgi:hypothetical protein
MPRSGSELLQVILHQNPDIYASPTSPLIEYQFAARSAFDLAEVKSQPHELMSKAFVSMCSSMAQGYYSAITDRPIVIDKSRGWIHYAEWVKLWSPKLKIICMIRDLREILASMELIYRNNRHLPIGPDDPTNMNALTINGRVKHWLDRPPVGLALQRLYDAISKGQADNIHFVKYEDLCTFPRPTMKAIYDFLEIDYYEHDFLNLVKVPQEVDHIFGPYGSHLVAKILKQNPEQRWPSVLGEPVCEQVIKQHRWYFDLFYPES